MARMLDKNYDPKAIEDRLYRKWTENGYFRATPNSGKKPHTIVMPPPNITGQLHMGHALDNSIQDALTRWKRMCGFEALWLPGTDHASISTEVKIVAKLLKEGLSKSDVGREGFLKHAWDWKNQYGSTIVEQLKKLGASCDWERERFTLDPGLSDAVLEVFVRLYNEGLIYRGEKLVNWCPQCKTSISDAEVEHEEQDGAFWYFKYRIDGTDEFLTFATTRPETMLGDTAIAVNPNDLRYTHLVGKTCTVPIVNRQIPIIADEYVEMDFGTGVVKITPAHDPNDFIVGERHNLPMINVMNDDGTINANGAGYEGLDRYDARKKIVAEFESLGLFVKKEGIKHSVGTHDRCGKVVEPLMKLQWFVKMETLAKPALEAYQNGELKIVPARFGKIYQNWLVNIKDWCISRQLWWGHRIPAYYCADCGHMEISKTAVSECTKCGSKNITQDEDSLDTWFSSALWPFSTLGWPNQTEELDYFYPTDVLVTSYDIIFFWVVRMVFSGLHYTGKLPFHTVLIHGLIRDSEGRKMSKSLNNGVDPLEAIATFGADCLRFTLITTGGAGNDLRFYPERLESTRNFNNKIWNATRFIMMNLDTDVPAVMPDLTVTDKWILSKFNDCAREVNGLLTNYDLNMAATSVQDFIWDEFCDWYIEMVKPRLYNHDDTTRIAALWTLKNVLIGALKLLHPFMPFITEEIFLTLQDEEETIMRSEYPQYNEAFHFASESDEIGATKTAIKAIRNIRTEMNVQAGRKALVYAVSAHEDVRKQFEEGRAYFKTLGSASDLIIQADMAGIPETAVSVVVPRATLYMPLEDLVDFEKEIARLKKEREKLIKEIERVDSKLNNQGFMAKAPENVVAEERGKREKYSELLASVEEQLKRYER